ncbi:MAG TPA: crosslink repair DNA glycosylase YcaQ family protein [Thermoplasmata archaeon]|nr:crosslink repair DNA glycosylase YcaQ family protein [Thermoplasmata archaeon]
MTEATHATTLEAVRRLVVTKQRLAGRLPTRVTPSRILDVVRDLAFVQWDPISIVAPSHLLALWSRVGAFRPSVVERMLWEEKSLLEHWTPIASLVRTEDFPIYRALMRRYPDSLSRSWGSQRTAARSFLAAHSALRRRILAELAGGPLAVGQFADHLRTRRDDGEWTPASDLAQMLFHLQMSGDVMVVGREGNQNLYGLAERFLPKWVDRSDLSESEVERTAAQRAVRALGTATPAEINYYFVRGRYQELRPTLHALLAEGALQHLRVEGLSTAPELFIHRDDLPLLTVVGSDDWEPRTSLLPPFDNLIANQARTKRLFGFDYVREQFLPASKRRFGTYVLPILWGEQLIGRLDPRLDKARGILHVNAVYAEPRAPADRAVAREIAAAVGRLAGCVGATEVQYGRPVPTAWRSALH